MKFNIQRQTCFFQFKEIEKSILDAQTELGEVEDEISAVNIDKNFNENALKEESQKQLL